MTCRLTCARAAAAGEALELPGPYLDLASSGRRDDFRWFARSQGVAAEDVERLWHRVLEHVRAAQASSHAASRGDAAISGVPPRYDSPPARSA